MHPAKWISFIAQFAQVSRRQRQAGMALLRGNTPHDATVALLKRVAQLRLACPVCHSPQARRIRSPETLLNATLGAFPRLTGHSLKKSRSAIAERL